MSTPPTMTIPEFSAHLGYGRTYGYQLQKEGRLVMTEDGKRVLVAESQARIAATADPSKRGVASRHAAARAAATVPTETTPPVGDDDEDQDIEPDADAPVVGYNYQSSKAKREHFAAERELTAHRREAGELIEVGEHVAAFARAGAALRAGLESWASTLPPQLLGRDEATIRATLADQVESLLRELSTQIGSQAQEAQP